MREILPIVMDPLLREEDRPTVVMAAVAGDEPPSWLAEMAAQGQVALRMVDASAASSDDLEGADVVIADAAAGAHALVRVLELSFGDEVRPWPFVAVTGIDLHAAVGDAFAAAVHDHAGRLEERRIAGLGGLGLLVPVERLSGGLGERLAVWRLPDPIDTHIRRLEEARADAVARAQSSPTAAPDVLADTRSEVEALRERVRALAGETTSLRRAVLERDAQIEALRFEAATLADAHAAVTGAVDPPELLTARRAERRHAAELVERLRAATAAMPDGLDEALPIDPAGDVRAVTDLPPEHPAVEVVVRPAGPPQELRAAIVALLRGTGRPFALVIDPADAPAETAAWIERLPAALPEVGIGSSPAGADWLVELDAVVRVVPGWLDVLLDAAREDPGAGAFVAAPSGTLPVWLPESAAAGIDAEPVGRDVALRATRQGGVGVDAGVPGVLAVADDAPPPAGGWPPEPLAVLSAGRGVEIAYLLPGLPEGGGGGSHSIVQEARTLAALGAPATVLVPSSAIERARAVYPEARDILRSFESDDELRVLIGEVDVAVATEAPSVRRLRDVLQGRFDTLLAYYVQDYEPLFGPAAGPRSDEALLSYRAVAGQVLFAKTQWLCDLVGVAHGIAVVKVEPSLDRAVFHPGAPRDAGSRPLRVVGMIRPRTPRRRPAATAHVLRRAASELQADVVSFGCDAEALATVAVSSAGFEHRGILTREQVADLMRWADVFVDLSVYQAFGRSGLEAMACGCVPILPPLGGVSEYARDGVDSLLVDAADEQAVVSALAALDADRERLRALSVAGAQRAQGWSLERAALSIHAALARAVAQHRRADDAVRAW